MTVAGDGSRDSSTRSTSPPSTSEVPRAAHWWLATALLAGALGATLGLACILLAPSTPARAVALSATLGRVGIVVLSSLIALAWGAIGGMLATPILRRARVAEGLFAFALWLWLVPFVAEIGYRHALGMQPTASALAPIFDAPGPFIRALPVGAVIGLVVGLLVLFGIALLIARLAPRVARSVASVRPPIAAAVVATLLITAAVGTTRIDARWAWVQRGVPLVALIFGVKVPTLSDYATSVITPGAPIGSATGAPLTRMTFIKVPTATEYATTSITPGPSLVAAGAPPDAAPKRVPNVLLIVLESVNASYVGYGGAPRPVTPNIDRLAMTSRRMRRAWGLAPVTSPSVGGMLTSTLPRRGWRFDTYTNTDYPRESLYSVMRSRGVETASISGDDQTGWGLLAFLAPVQASYTVTPRDLPGEHFNYGDDQSADDHEVATRAIDWMSEQTKPWTLYVNFHRTHFPYVLPKGHPYPFQPVDTTPGRFNLLNYPVEDRVKARNLFDGTLQYVDTEVGRLLDGLDAKGGGLDNTLVVLLSDHGEAFGEHNIVDHSKSVYDPEMRVPLLLRWPGHIEPGDDYSPVSIVDITPTILSLVGIRPPPAMQGSDMLAHGKGQRAVILEVQVLGMQDAIVCWPWKLLIDRPTDDAMLFNLEQDPKEMENVAIAHAKVSRSLRELLEAMNVAQVSYYESAEKRLRYPPRIPMCPALPNER